MRKNFFLPFAVFIILGMAVAACSPVTPATQEPAATPQSTSPNEAYYSLTVETGVEQVDRVLEAVASGDPQALRAVVEFTEAICTQGDGLGGPPKCREGEAEGSPMEVLPFIGSEGSFIRKDEIERWTGIDVSGVYAIYEVSSDVSPEQYYPAGEYVILFVSDENQPAVALRVGESGIVRVDHIFDSSVQSLNAMLEREASAVLLPPKS
jgi:hypothetical protein